MSIEITIPGLTVRQCMIADILWLFEHSKDADRYISSLPTLSLRQEAKTIKGLMVMAAIEQAYSGISDNSEACSLLDKFRIQK